MMFMVSIGQCDFSLILQLCHVVHTSCVFSMCT